METRMGILKVRQPPGPRWGTSSTLNVLLEGCRSGRCWV